MIVKVQIEVTEVAMAEAHFLAIAPVFNLEAKNFLGTYFVSGEYAQFAKFMAAVQSQAEFNESSSTPAVSTPAPVEANVAKAEQAFDFAKSTDNEHNGLDRCACGNKYWNANLSGQFTCTDCGSALGTTAAEWFAARLTEKFADQGAYASKMFGCSKPGAKYTRVWQTQAENADSKSVHCFVENATGAVYKAAGWKAPATGVRFANVAEALDAATLHGGYLYVK